MKKILMAAVALTAMASTPALATADPSATFTVNGSVANTCNIGAGSPFNINSGTISTDVNGNLSGTNTGTSSSVSVVCNDAGAQINIAHAALVNSSAPADGNGFTKTIDFVPTGTLTNNSVTSGLVEGDNNTGVVNGTLTVTAASLSTASSAKPYAGSYSGTITVTVKAN